MLLELPIADRRLRFLIRPKRVKGGTLRAIRRHWIRNVLGTRTRSFSQLFIRLDRGLPARITLRGRGEDLAVPSGF